MNGILKIKWDFCEKTPEIGRPWVLVVAKCDFALPEWVKEKKNCRIEITTDKDESFYQSTIWWFNRGVDIVAKNEESRNMFECIKITETRIFELFNIIINDRQD